MWHCTELLENKSDAPGVYLRPWRLLETPAFISVVILSTPGD